MTDAPTNAPPDTPRHVPLDAAPVATLSAGGSDAGPLAEIRVLKPVSVVVPTYREVENIPALLDRLDRLRRRFGLDLEVLFMDDDSRDGSVEAVRAAGHDWARIVVRDGPRGLAPAVIEGMRLARHPILVCMDCDLSHPPEKIPDMILALGAGQQMVLGSRYVAGGTTDDDWGYGRYLASTLATFLARPLTSAADPMSGFFALRRRDFLAARDLNPVGYKIALELIVKCAFDNVGEVPIHFADRTRGQSKLTIREQLRYLRHLRRLYIHRFANAMYAIQFAVVGAIGTVVNLGVLTALEAAGATRPAALAGGIAASLVGNFVLNRRFTFDYARGGNVWAQFAGFLGASAIGMAVNYAVAIGLGTGPLAGRRWGLQAAALAGIAAGMAFNFVGNRFVVFRRRHVAPRPGRAGDEAGTGAGDGAGAGAQTETPVNW